MIPRFGLTKILSIGLLVAVIGLAGCGGAAGTATPTSVSQVSEPTATTAAAGDMSASDPTAGMSSTPDMVPTQDAGAAATSMPAPEATSGSSSGADGSTGATPTDPAAAPAGGSQGTTVKATLREWGLDLDQTQVPAGPVHFVVTNTGMMQHNFTIKDSSGSGLGRIPNFSSSQSPQTLDVTLQPGTYTVYCSLPGHAARGQQNTLVVK